MDAISAMERTTGAKQIACTTVDQKRPARPPSTSPWSTLKMPNSHTYVAMALNEKVATSLKCRTNTCCFPMRLICTSSAVADTRSITCCSHLKAVLAGRENWVQRLIVAWSDSLVSLLLISAIDIWGSLRSDISKSHQNASGGGREIAM